MAPSLLTGVFIVVSLAGVLCQPAINPAQLPQVSATNPAANPDGCAEGSLSDHVESITNNLPSSLSSGGGALDSINAVLRGRNMSNPANSCNEILMLAPDNTPSGYYWIKNQGGSSVRVFCEMNITCGCSSQQGWIRVSILDMAAPNASCPSHWRKLQANGKAACGKKSNGFSWDAQRFDMESVSYQKVCGKIIGFVFGSPDGFNRWGSQQWRTVNQVYFDGIDIVHGNPVDSTNTISYSHIWSNAANFYDYNNVCPCASNSNRPVPGFVGNNYFCEGGGTISAWSASLKPEDPLWDGKLCRGGESTCCSSNSGSVPPQFCRELDSVTSEDMYIRLMSDGNLNDEDVPVHYYELYVQ